MTHSKNLTGMQQNIYITDLVKLMEQGREYTSRQMAGLLKITPKTMRSLIQKMRVCEIIIKTSRTPINLWKLNPVKMPKWVNMII